MLVAMSTGMGILILGGFVVGVMIVTALTMILFGWATKDLPDNQAAVFVAMKTYQDLTHQNDPSYWSGSDSHNEDNK